MKILIVGSGAQGSVIASEIVKSEAVSKIVVSDIDLKKAENLAKRLKSEKVHVVRVDASDVDSVMDAAEGVDIIVNATTQVLEFNLNIMEAALRSGACYQDLASYPDEQLELSEKWREAGLTALIDTGVSPGVTNVLAANAADKLDEVEEIRIRVWVADESEVTISTWSPETAWSDMAYEPIVYEDGKFNSYPPFSGEEVYPFPDPIGPQTVYLHTHEEPYTLPHFIGKGVRYVDFKMGGSDFPLAKALVEFGLLSDKPVKVKGVEVAPLDVLLALVPPTPSMEEMEELNKAGKIDMRGCLAIEVTGYKQSEKKRRLVYLIIKDVKELLKKMPGATPVSYFTSVPASIFTKMLAKGEIKTRGVVPPEGLESKVRQTYQKRLAEKGIIIHEKVETI